MRIRAFGVLSAVDVAAAAAGERARRLRRFSKPALMPLLAARIWRNAGQRTAAAVPNRGSATAGVALSGVGDVALLGRSEPAFLVGLGAFLAGHLAYARGFAQAGGWAGLRREPWRAVPAAAFGVAGAVAILPKAGELAVPVAGYIGVISSMAALATGTGNRTSIAGAGLFCLSDLILGLARFREPSPTPGRIDAAVMATYTAGQHLIVRGLTGR